MLKEADSILPAHIGIIMDGNGRWAKQHGQPRINGHREGAARVRDVVEWARDAGIRQLSLYAFSTENWNRPRLEVRALMSLLAFVLPQNVPGMQAEGVRFRVLGDISALPGSARRAVEQACEETADNDAIDLIMCLNYGGQQEIIAGVQRAIGWIQAKKDQQKALAELTPEMFRSMLWRRDIAPLDLLIRTGGERRISNFHLWDAAYAELYFTDVYWPDYSRREFQAALNDYAARERRYGKTSDQVAA